MSKVKVILQESTLSFDMKQKNISALDVMKYIGFNESLMKKSKMLTPTTAGEIVLMEDAKYLLEDEGEIVVKLSFSEDGWRTEVTAMPK